jgi:hypothetical protein
MTLSAKLTTGIKISKKVHNNANRETIIGFYDYLKDIDTSENYQNCLLKVLIGPAKYRGPVVYTFQCYFKEICL